MVQRSQKEAASTKRVVGVGAGGHARVVLDILRSLGGHEVVGLVDVDEGLWGQELEGVPVVGDDTMLAKLYEDGVTHAFNGIGSAPDTGPRTRSFQMIAALGFQMVQAIHSKATIAPSVTLGAGIAVMANAVINPAARAGANVIVNTGAIVEHDCVLGDHTHIATGSRLGGGVSVGEGSHIGIGASVRQGISIGRNSVVGAGAAVVEDVPDGVVVAGVPAKVLRAAEV